MSLWSRLWGVPAPPAADILRPRPALPPAQVDEEHLERALQGPLQAPLAAEIVAAVERLAERRPRVAARFLGRLHAALPQEPRLALRLAELLLTLGEPAPAVALLQRLVAAPAPEVSLRLLAHARLSEALEATGDTAGARQQLEVILAEDVDFPQARLHLARLTGSPGGAGATATASGADHALAVVTELMTVASVGGVRYQRYQLVRELGRGGAGTVYLARDIVLERELALKLFHAATRREGGAPRAWNEARLTAAVRHPGVVAVYDLDEERGLVAMELCTGGSLQRRLREGRLPAAAALRRGSELLETLAMVHQAGVVHGDLKPGNLLFRGTTTRAAGQEAGSDSARYGDLVIADFGTAQLLGAPSEDGPAAGTLGYLAPERRRPGGLGLQPAADLYAAGAVLLEMLLGSSPLSRSDLLLRGERPEVHLSGPAAAELGPRVAAVEALLRRLLAADPGARPSAAEALRGLTELC